jgi:hypothetical protein
MQPGRGVFRRFVGTGFQYGISNRRDHISPP